MRFSRSTGDAVSIGEKGAFELFDPTRYRRSRQVDKRVFGVIPLSNFKMKVRAGGPSRTPYQGNNLTLPDLLTLFNEVPEIVSIDRLKTVVVFHNHCASISVSSPPAVGHHAIPDCANSSPGGCVDIDARMVPSPPPAEPGSHPAFERPDEVHSQGHFLRRNRGAYRSAGWERRRILYAGKGHDSNTDNPFF